VYLGRSPKAFHWGRDLLIGFWVWSTDCLNVRRWCKGHWTIYAAQQTHYGGNRCLVFPANQQAARLSRYVSSSHESFFVYFNAGPGIKLYLLKHRPVQSRLKHLLIRIEFGILLPLIVPVASMTFLLSGYTYKPPTLMIRPVSCASLQLRESTCLHNAHTYLVVSASLKIRLCQKTTCRDSWSSEC
jgi:hypothetical protein